MFELESSDNREELLRFKMMKMWSATLGRPSEEERERKKRLKELHMSQDPYRGASTNNTLKSIKRRKEKQKKAKSPNGDEGTNTSLPRNGILNNNYLYPEVKMRQHSKSMGHGLNLIKNANYLPNRRYTVAMDGDEEFPEMMMMREQKLRFMDEGLDWDRSDSGTPRSSGSRSGVSGGRRWKKGLSVSMVNVDRLGKGGPNLGDHPSTPNYWGSGVWNHPNTMEERVDNRPPVLNRRSLVINAMNDFNKQSDSCGPTTNGEMVSRRKILSRSRDDLNLDVPAEHPDEEDVWYQKEKLFKDHIQEVLNKWESIDDEIWAKIIVLERNRRVAKAYARAPVLTVNGSDDGFDGFRIGLSGFENPMRDPKTDEVKRHIGQGCKIKMDDSGNILIKRIAKSNVYIKSTLNTPEDTAIANDILKLPNGGLEAEKPVKLFDMKKFQQNVSRELKRGYPDRRKLECQCISAVAFVKNEADILEAPCWIMLINVVAMDMLKSKMPPVKNPRPAIDIRNRPRIPIPDEDPYSIAGSGSSGSSGNGNRERSRDKPPKLPPRDNNAIYGTTGMPRPDYEHMVDEHRFRQQLEARNKAPKKGEKRSDDPYYCGLRARIPNFAKTKAQRDKEAANSIYARLPTHAQPQAHPGYGHIGMYGPARGFLDNVPPPSNNMNNGYSFRNRPFERNPTTWVPKAPMRNDYESDYSHIYGRLPLPTRFRHAHGPPGRQMYVSEWE